MSKIPPEPPGGKPPSRRPKREDFATFEEYAKSVTDWIAALPEAAAVDPSPVAGHAIKDDAFERRMAQAAAAIRESQKLLENRQVKREKNILDKMIEDNRRRTKIRFAREEKEAAETHALRAEMLRRRLNSPPASDRQPIAAGDVSTKRKGGGRKPGVKHADAMFAGIERIAGQNWRLNWKSHLPEICAELDAKGVSRPPKWPSWAGQLTAEAELVRKNIIYYLDRYR
jgi:hypothetical protein